MFEKKNLKYLLFITFVFVSCIMLSACTDLIDNQYIEISNGEEITLEVGENYSLNYSLYGISGTPEWKTSDSDCVNIDQNGKITAYKEGNCIITIFLDEETDNIIIKVVTNKDDIDNLEIINEETELAISKTLTLKSVSNLELSSIKYEIKSGIEYASIDGNVLTGIKEGKVEIIAKIGDLSSSIYSINIFKEIIEPTSIDISVLSNDIYINDTINIKYTVKPIDSNYDLTFYCTNDPSLVSINDNYITALKEGKAIIVAYYNDLYSNEITINIKKLDVDPYKNISEDDFYDDYQEATSYKDSYYRSLHYFMSGSIDDQDQEPTISTVQPKENNLFIRNSSSYYSEDKNTYYIVDYNNEIVDEIYKGGAYVLLEEVAAYVYAFGDAPINYNENKGASPKKSEWGKWLRVNNTYFSGDTSSYPYEPILPNIQGCGGDFAYYEMDIGTTGTDCDPSYSSAIYNSGTKITRGAARIVYSKFYENGDPIDDLDDRYVFYTYNHYNDFQEYLNYYGGWGKMFGNITGGGKISSRSDYNPTDYPNVVKKEFDSSLNNVRCLYNNNIIYYLSKNEEIFL